jgi:hypothetical protein
MDALEWESMNCELDIGVLIQVFSSINGPGVRDILPEGEYVTPSTALSKSRRTTSQAALSGSCVSQMTALPNRSLRNIGSNNVLMLSFGAACALTNAGIKPGRNS